MTSVMLLLLAGCFPERASYPGSDVDSTDVNTADADTTAPDTDVETSPSADTAAESLCDSGEVVVRLGTGENSFELLEEGDALPMRLGTAGGWELLVGFELYNTHEVVEFSIAGHDDATGAPVCTHGNEPLTVATVEGEDCRRSYFNVRCYLPCPMDEALVGGECQNPNALLPDRALTLSIDLVDYNGAATADTLTITVAPDPAYPTSCEEAPYCF